MASAAPLTEKYGNLELPSDHPGFRMVFPLGTGQDSVITQLDGPSWPSGLVLTPQGSADGRTFHDLPNTTAFSSLGEKPALNVQGLAFYAVRVSTPGAAGWVAVAARGHQDFRE